MKIFRMLIIIAVLSLISAATYYFWFSKKTDTSFVVRDLNYSADHKAIDDLFHKGDNWYWMISTDNTDTYSIDFMLKNKTSSQKYIKKDMIFKVAIVHGKIAGFLGFYPLSARVWQLLFLIVDQDFRRQGIARKLLDFAVHDMVGRGALRINLATRNNNFKAQALYLSYGFKLVDDNDDDFVHFSWYKSESKNNS